MSLLRMAAHDRHRMVSTSWWWWCPPMHAVSLAIHAQIVDSFYDALEGPTPPFFLFDDEDEELRRDRRILAEVITALNRVRAGCSTIELRGTK